MHGSLACLHILQIEAGLYFVLDFILKATHTAEVPCLQSKEQI